MLDMIMVDEFRVGNNEVNFFQHIYKILFVKFYFSKFHIYISDILFCNNGRSKTYYHEYILGQFTFSKQSNYSHNLLIVIHC